MKNTMFLKVMIVSLLLLVAYLCVKVKPTSSATMEPIDSVLSAHEFDYMLKKYDDTIILYDRITNEDIVIPIKDIDTLVDLISEYPMH